MAESTIPVDLLNPGQVFACLGILEMADMLLGDGAAAFDWNSDQETTFRVSTAGAEPPVERIMRFLEEARIVTRAPAGSANPGGWKTSWGDAPEVDDPREPFPFPDPSSPATLPVVVRDNAGNEVMIDYWGDATRRDNVKFWAGAQGKPGAAIFRDALCSVRGKLRQHVNDPFAISAPQTISFRFDWRRDYIPVQDGFRRTSIREGCFPFPWSASRLLKFSRPSVWPMPGHTGKPSSNIGTAYSAATKVHYWSPFFIGRLWGRRHPPFLADRFAVSSCISTGQDRRAKRVASPKYRKRR